MLRALGDGVAPPAGLEDATVARLAREGLLGRPRWRRLGPGLAAAAAVALFAAGLAVGERRGGVRAPDPGVKRYVLLLYDAPDEGAMTSSDRERRVSEYRDWAQDVRRRGGRIEGEKLEDEALRLGPAEPAPGRPIGGYFVVSAADDAAALAIARSCPHLKHGGAIEVRAIAKT
ncbi:MAG TPA: YciI family protein [Thermoanaerobaculia bacterium]|nr:YciI family protein [Thermoanaerobaculia bacterium]